jgi:hypothetical protein
MVDNHFNLSMLTQLLGMFSTIYKIAQQQSMLLIQG